MSQNLYRLTSRTRMVDDRGFPTAEFLRFAEALFARVGGFEGFSNQELFGEVAAPVPYDELLGRIGDLEAQLRGMRQEAQQAMQISFEMGQQQERASQAAPQDTLKVKGMAELNTTTGRTLIGDPEDDGTTQLQVNGDIAADNINAGGNLHASGDLSVDGSFSIGTLSVTNLTTSGAATIGTTLGVTGNTTVGGQLDVTGPVTAASANVTNEYSVAALQVVGPRVTGWGAPTGVVSRTAYAVYPGQTISATYDPVEVQALDDAVADLSAKFAALVTDARAHGLIGD